MFQVKFNRFLHPNEHPQRISWYLVTQLRSCLVLSGVRPLTPEAGVFPLLYSTHRNLRIVLAKSIAGCHAELAFCYQVCSFTCSVSTIVVANIAKSWTLHHALHAGHWLYCIFLTWSHSSWTGYFLSLLQCRFLWLTYFSVKHFMLFSFFGNEYYS